MIRRIALIAASLLAVAPAVADENSECADAAEAGQRLRDQHELLEARARFLRCARESCHPIVRGDCVKFLEDLAPTVPSVVFRVRGSAGQDLAEVVVKRDGAVLAQRTSGEALELDPGASTFRFEATGFAPKEQRLVIAEGEQRRGVEVTLDPAGAPATPVSAPSALAPDAGGGPGPAPWVVGAIGLASLVGFGVLEGVAWGEYGDIEDRCGSEGTCTDDDLDPLRGKYIGAIVLLGVGVAALATATVVYVTLAEDAPSGADVALRSSVGPAALTVGLSGHF